MLAAYKNTDMPLRIIYLDLNSYFASVEQAERPELMGQQIAVVPSLAETTCCLAASYPAKACGVRTGTLVRDARKLCPKIVFIQADISALAVVLSTPIFLQRICMNIFFLPALTVIWSGVFPRDSDFTIVLIGLCFQVFTLHLGQAGVP